jgi:hypothetical protein
MALMLLLLFHVNCNFVTFLLGSGELANALRTALVIDSPPQTGPLISYPLPTIQMSNENVLIPEIEVFTARLKVAGSDADGAIA